MVEKASMSPLLIHVAISPHRGRSTPSLRLVLPSSSTHGHSTRLQTGWLASWLATLSLDPGSYVAGVNGAVWLVGEMELSAAADIHVCCWLWVSGLRRNSILLIMLEPIVVGIWLAAGTWDRKLEEADLDWDEHGCCGVVWFFA